MNGWVDPIVVASPMTPLQLDGQVAFAPLTCVVDCAAVVAQAKRFDRWLRQCRFSLSGYGNNAGGFCPLALKDL